MANIAPCSTITLYSGVAITNGQQIAFKNSADQIAYFNSKKISGHEETQCTYVRHNRGYIKIEDTMGVMLSCNYISWKNANAGFENKTIYARVTDFEYINNSTVKIYYTIDWFQTFMFDVTYETAVLEREHLSVSDWSSATTNPYRNDIYELLTEEDIVNVDKSMEKFYSTYARIQPHLTGYSGTPMSQDVAFTYAAGGVICMLISNFDRTEFSPDPFNDFDVYIESNGSVVKPTGGDATLQAQFTSVTVKVPVPRAFTIGFLSLSQSLSKMKNIIDFLTLQGLTCQIIGAYLIDSFYIDAFLDTVDGKSHNTYYTINKGVAGFTGMDPKLYRSPFQYIRVENSNGDSKEYQYENFSNIATDNARLYYLATIDGMPMEALVPASYKDNLPMGATGYETMGLNMDERVEFASFPQIGFTTDAYLTFLSNQYNQNLQSRTTASEQTTKVGEVGNIIGNFLGSAASMVGLGGQANYGGLPANAINTLNGAIGGMNRMQAYDEASVLRNLGGEDASMIASGDAVSEVFNEAKKGFVADQYHAGSSGSLPYYTTALSAGSFRITRVQLKETYQKQINAVFTRYGYASHRVGLPRICNYMSNSADNTKLPKFLKQADGLNETYVKCREMDVQCPMKPVADFFEQMFKNGMRFVDGSSLITP